MLQIVHDIAPKARECFATAFTGDLGFADNIRALADPQRRLPRGRDRRRRRLLRRAVLLARADQRRGRRRRRPGRALLLQRRQRLLAAGLRGAAADREAHRRARTSTSPASIPSSTPAASRTSTRAGTDIAQNLVLGGDPTSDDGGSDGILDLQWDDPVDPNGAPLGDPLIDTDGRDHRRRSRSRRSRSTAPPARRSRRSSTRSRPARPTSSSRSRTRPGTRCRRSTPARARRPSCRRWRAPAPTRSRSRGFDGDLGDFTFKVQPVLGSSRTTTDLNALFFDAGEATSCSPRQDLNRLSGKPFEIAGFHGKGALQLVIAKANTDAGAATQLRYQLYDGLEYTEYVQPLAPSIYGHPLARGATAVAAYDPFRPFLPEDYTSVGGDLPIYFDSDGNRLPRPDIRRAPQVAATDGGNTTFFTVDSKLDPDSQPNFFGTSAAAPHAAAIAALVLQTHGRDLQPGRAARATAAQHVRPRPRRRPRRGLEPGPDDHRQRRAGRGAPRHAPGVDDAGLDGRPALLHRRLHRQGHAHVAHARRPDRRAALRPAAVPGYPTLSGRCSGSRASRSRPTRRP